MRNELSAGDKKTISPEIGTVTCEMFWKPDDSVKSGNQIRTLLAGGEFLKFLFSSQSSFDLYCCFSGLARENSREMAAPQMGGCKR